MIRVFANGPDDLVQSQVESYQRLKNGTLSIIRYSSRVKWDNQAKRAAYSPISWCSCY